jgi:RNA recognition motif-containing protein
MRKERKTPKSRGFGFVQMPDEQQALAAIAALNGKEFMGRVLDVNPARPKAGAQAVVELKEKRQPKVTVETEQHPREEIEQKKTWFSPVFNKPGTYRGGRRTRSYMSRRGLAGMQEEAKPRRRSQDNPMRWRKRKDQAKPWQKSPGEHKPWEKAEGGARPWKKAEGESKPWRKSEGGIKPWKKPAGDAKPWGRSMGEPKPLKRKEGEFKPWRKSVGESKPWRRKSNKRKRLRQSRIESRRKPGGYTR